MKGLGEAGEKFSLFNFFRGKEESDGSFYRHEGEKKLPEFHA
jgi:hypothetical protein